MDALPFNRRPGQAEPVDWNRRVFLVGYVGGLAVFLVLIYYSPDTTLETWAKREAEKRMRERGVDLFWYEKERYSELVK
jgi:hypothetical protein